VSACEGDVQLRICNGCGGHYQPYHNSRGRCRDCRRAYEQKRGTRHERGLGNAWLRLRDQAIAERPFCQYCGATSDLTGDHRIPRSRGGVARTVEDIIVACRSCNSSRGARAPTSPVQVERPPEPSIRDWVA
jgi:5-methylcytosine-specific restriction endonuclease McrA